MTDIKGKLDLNKLILGTAQFGKNYGITNAKQISSSEVKSLLDYAKDNKLNQLDTANSYGDSEKLIGKNNNKYFNISTKLSCPSSIQNFNKKLLFDQVDISLNKVKTDMFETLFVHNAKEFINDSKNDFYKNLLCLKDMKKTKKIGVSVYDPLEVYKLLDIYDIDVIQLPLNLFDQRFIDEKIIHYLEKKGVEIHIRSIFLQGVLLSSRSTLPKYFEKWNEKFHLYYHWLTVNNIDPISACINFVYNKFSNFKIIIGVNSKKDLVQIISNYKKCNPINTNMLKNDDPELIDPRKWN